MSSKSDTTLVSEESKNIQSDINQISIKLPPWFGNPDLWIKQVEAFYATSKPPIKLERNKYYHLICHLPGHVLELIADTLDPTADRPYSKVIEAIRMRLTPSKTDTFAALKNIKLEGRRPFAVVAEIKEKSRRLNITSEDVLRETFLNSLPENVRGIMIPQAYSLSLDELAQTADNLISNQSSHSAVASVSQPSGNDDAIQQLQSQVGEIFEKINAMTFNSSKNKQFCYYHKRFGKAAFKCQNPCDWQPSNNTHFEKLNRPRRGNQTQWAQYKSFPRHNQGN